MQKFYFSSYGEKHKKNWILKMHGIGIMDFVQNQFFLIFQIYMKDRLNRKKNQISEKPIHH